MSKTWVLCTRDINCIVSFGHFCFNEIQFKSNSAQPKWCDLKVIESNENGHIAVVITAGKKCSLYELSLAIAYDGLRWWTRFRCSIGFQMRIVFCVAAQRWCDLILNALFILPISIYSLFFASFTSTIQAATDIFGNWCCIQRLNSSNG